LLPLPDVESTLVLSDADALSLAIETLEVLPS